MRMPKTLSIDAVALSHAEQLRKLRLFPDLSTLVEQLLVEEWERRHGPLKLDEHSPAVTQHPTAPHKVSYKKSSSKPGRKVV
jgi:hypothetical protein